jgi:antigen KI-67
MDMENEETPKAKPFPWVPALGLAAIGAVGVIGFAVTRGTPTPAPASAADAPRHKPAEADTPAPDPKPAPVYVDVRSLIADAKRNEADDAVAAPATPRATTRRPATPRTAAPRAAAPRPAAPEPAAEVPTTVARGTGVIAVKRGGRSMVTTVARVEDKPGEPAGAARSDAATKDSPKDPAGAAPTTKPAAAAPRVYGEEAPKENVDSSAPMLPFQHRQRGTAKQDPPPAPAGQDPNYYSGTKSP